MNRFEYQEVHLTQLCRYVPSISTDEMSEDFFMSRVSSGAELKMLDHPFRFDGYFAYFCVKGKFDVEINMRKIEIAEGSLLLYVPGNIVTLCNFQDVEKSQFVVVAVSRRIMQNAKIDFSKLYDEAMKVMSNPCIRLGEEEVEICTSYYRLSEKLISAAKPRLEVTLIDLGSSLFHYLGNLWSEHISKEEELTNSTLRSKALFERFMKLVSEYHMVEREVSFYADKLYVTPKYLSQLVRKISGQSAPEWIASFVILEAKNYLKYSDLDVKEIAYKLHFSSPPAFFRYFKAHTGTTPLEFRKS